MIRTLLPDLACLFLILAVAAGGGKKVLERALGFQFPGRWVSLVFSVGTGLALLSFAVFFIGFFGFVERWAFLLLLLSVGTWSAREIREFFLQLAEIPSLVRSSVSGRFEWFIFTMLVAAVLSNLVFNYSPPILSRDYDITFPRYYIEQGRIFDISDQAVAYYPMQIQMLFLLAMSLKSVLAAKLVHYSFGILAAALVYVLSKRIAGRRAALFSAALFYLMPMVSSVSGTANIELGQMFYGLLAAASFLFWTEGLGDRWLYFAGFAAGVTAGTKIPGVTVPIALFCMAAYTSVRNFKEEKWNGLKKVIVFGGFVVLGFSPWLVRNLVFVGNPVAPFSVPAFGWKAHEAAALEVLELGKLHVSLRDHLRGIHNIFFGDFIWGGGPLLFAFLLPAFLNPGTRRTNLILFLFAVLNYVLLFKLLPYPHEYYETRYYCVSYGVFALLSGIGLDSGLSLFRENGGMKKLVLAALLFPTLTFCLLLGAKRIPVFLGTESAEHYLQSKLTNYGLMVKIDQIVPDSSRIVILGMGDVKPFYCKARFLTPSLKLLGSKEEAAVLEELKKAGATHVIFFKNSLERDEQGKFFRHVRIPLMSVHWDWDAMNKQALAEIYSDTQAVLYRINFP